MADISRVVFLQDLNELDLSEIYHLEVLGAVVNNPELSVAETRRCVEAYG